jgi:2-haloalkanoic acid dehalogenase type II
MAKVPMLQKPIHWISFDLDHTLWDSDPALAQANQIMLEQLEALNPTASKVTEQFWQETAQQVAALSPGLQPTQRRQHVLRYIIQQWQLPERHVESLFSSWFNKRQQVVYYNEVASVLDCLAQSYSLIALTNGNACRQQTGADRWFNHWISADDVGFAKPAPEPFAAALQIMQCQPSQVLHVGDHPHHDVIGAEKMGMQTAWMNRNRQSWTEALAQHSIEPENTKIRPNIEVSNLKELLTWLRTT